MTFGATFLERPDRFPAAGEGSPWGDRDALLALPGGPYRLTGLSASQAARVGETFPGAHQASLAAPATPASPAPPATDAPPATAAAVATPTAPTAAIEVAVRRASLDDFRPIDTRGWDYALELDHEPATVRLAGLGLMGLLAGIDDVGAGAAPSRAAGRPPGLRGVLWTPADGDETFPGICENFLRVLVAYRFLALGGLVLHSSGLVKDGRAYLMLGRSGAGKTTTARLALERGGEVLSDDLNALCREPAGPAGAVCVHKLPFTGDIGDRRAVRPPLALGGILWLVKDDRDALAPLSTARTAACLLACAPFLNADPCRRERLEAVALDLAAAAGRRAALLRFTMGGGFWSILGLE